MEVIGAVIMGLVASLAAAEVWCWLPRLIAFALRRAINRLPPEKQERYEEEWNAELIRVPGRLGRCIFAFDLWLRASRRLEEFFTEQRLLQSPNLRVYKPFTSYEYLRALAGKYWPVRWMLNYMGWIAQHSELRELRLVVSFYFWCPRWLARPGLTLICVGICRSFVQRHMVIEFLLSDHGSSFPLWGHGSPKELIDVIDELLQLRYALKNGYPVPSFNKVRVSFLPAVYPPQRP